MRRSLFTKRDICPQMLLRQAKNSHAGSNEHRKERRKSMRNVYCRGISRLLCIAFILTLLTGCSAASKESQKQGMHLDGSLEAATVDAENVQYIKARLLQPRYADVMGHISTGAEFCGDRYWVLGNGVGKNRQSAFWQGPLPGTPTRCLSRSLPRRRMMN